MIDVFSKNIVAFSVPFIVALSKEDQHWPTSLPRLTNSKDERVSSRNKAIAIASAISSNARTPHAFHTMAKSRLDILRDAFAEFQTDKSASVEALVEDSIKQVQQDITRGLRKFPGDGRLLTSQSELYSLLANNTAALRSLEKAFKFSPQSVLVAKRLAAAYEALDEFDKANDVLLTCLNHNVGNHDLHAQTGMNYLRKAKDRLDLDTIRTANYHLGRAIQGEGGRYEEKFWYARGLFLEGDAHGARKLFARLKEAAVSTFKKREVRGVIRDQEGNLVQYIGEIVSATERYGFIRCEETAGDVFVDARELPAGALHVGTSLLFSVGFNYYNAVAQECEVDLFSAAS